MNLFLAITFTIFAFLSVLFLPAVFTSDMGMGVRIMLALNAFNAPALALMAWADWKDER